MSAERIFQQPKNENRKNSIKNEKKLSRQFGVKLVSNSGAGIQKGDLKTSRFMIEVKQTEKESISVKKEWIHKLMVEANQEGKEPVLVLDISGTRLFCVGEDIFSRKVLENV